MKDKTYQTLRETVNSTGLSLYFLKKELKAGRLPHIMSGNRVLVNVEKLLDILNKESTENIKSA